MYKSAVRRDGGRHFDADARHVPRRWKLKESTSAVARHVSMLAPQISN